MEEIIQQPTKILVVGPAGPGRQALIKQLKQVGGCWLANTADPSTALELLAAVQPDLALVDFRCPSSEYLAFLRQMRGAVASEGFLPIVVVLPAPAPELKAQVLGAGASDFLVEPFDSWDILVRLGHLLELRHLNRQTYDQEQLLLDGLHTLVDELEQGRLTMLTSLAQTAEERDDPTGWHPQRVGSLAGRLAEELGCPQAEVAAIQRTAPLHDVGKLQVPGRIWDKPGPLTAQERREMQTHTTLGGCLVDPGLSPVLTTAREIVLAHHERWDGTGYPYGLAGPAIPLPGRVVAVADVFDALTHDRPYRPAWSRSQARDLITAGSGRQLDPQVVAAFLHVMTEDDGLPLPGADYWFARPIAVPGSLERQ